MRKATDTALVGGAAPPVPRWFSCPDHVKHGGCFTAREAAGPRRPTTPTAVMPVLTENCSIWTGCDPSEIAAPQPERPVSWESRVQVVPIVGSVVVPVVRGVVVGCHPLSWCTGVVVQGAEEPAGPGRLVVRP